MTIDQKTAKFYYPCFTGTKGIIIERDLPDSIIARKEINFTEDVLGGAESQMLTKNLAITKGASARTAPGGQKTKRGFSPGTPQGSMIQLYR